MVDDERGEPSRPDVTALLQRWVQGDARAADDLLPLVYAELRRQARAFLRRERAGHTLEPTALVHEAYLRLVRQHDVGWAGRSHFHAIAAQAMRRVLIDHGRQRHAAKRGGLAHERVTLSGLAAPSDDREVDADLLHRALEQLEALDARQARIVELRFLTGLSVEETAAALDISVATVKRDWATARLWLLRELQRGGA
jgi:RNA polymerase sigma-70 factor (ECF subfamily)